MATEEQDESITAEYRVDDAELLMRIEALLFANNRYLSMDEIAKYCDVTIRDARKGVKLLQEELAKRKSSVILIDSDEGCKLSVNQKYSGIINKVVSQTELTKGLIETLAVIAWKNPIPQCEVVRYRHNKAYEHLSELEEKGFVTREEFGRTKLLKLTQKFYDYFDVPKNSKNLKQVMPEQMVKAIEQAEQELNKNLDASERLEAEAQNEQKEIREARDAMKDNSTLDKF